MDKRTSQNRILHHIIALEYTEDLTKLTEDLLGLLHVIDIYNFDFKDALVNAIKEIEELEKY